MAFPATSASGGECRMVYLSENPPSGTPDFLADYPDLLTVRHVCEITGLSEQTIRREINEGRLPACRIGRRLFCPKTSFAEYARSGGGLNG